MSLECCDKDGQPSAGILAVVPGMGSTDAELGRAGTIAVFEPSGRDETESMLPYLLMIPRFAFLTRSYSVLFSPFALAPLTVHFLFSPLSPPRFLYPSSHVHTPLNIGVSQVVQ